MSLSRFAAPLYTLIWSFLGGRDLVITCQCVCKNWRRLLTHDQSRAVALVERSEMGLVLTRQMLACRYENDLDAVLRSFATPHLKEISEALLQRVPRGNKLLQVGRHPQDLILLGKRQDNVLQKLGAFRERWIENYRCHPLAANSDSHSGCLVTACDIECLQRQHQHHLIDNNEQKQCCVTCEQTPPTLFGFYSIMFPIVIDPRHFDCDGCDIGFCRGSKELLFCNHRCAWRWMLAHALRDSCGHFLVPCVHALCRYPFPWTWRCLARNNRNAEWSFANGETQTVVNQDKSTVREVKVPCPELHSTASCYGYLVVPSFLQLFYCEYRYFWNLVGLCREKTCGDGQVRMVCINIDADVWDDNCKVTRPPKRQKRQMS